MGEEETRNELEAPSCHGSCGTAASALSRRRFLQALGLSATAATLPENGFLGDRLPAAEPAAQAPAVQAPAAAGPGAVPVTLKINGKPLALSLEPRVTLLDALRNHLLVGSGEAADLTGSKRVCDRASCGACTVIVDGKSAYACSILAIDAQDRDIRTVEGLEVDGKPHPVQEAFVAHDGLMCGFCTPGFVMASVALLESNPGATRADILRGLDGNICRCGTQCRVVEAVEAAAAKLKEGR
jgi:xanthine dehydrogenase YagT iron-sulfur-binding subunit